MIQTRQSGVREQIVRGSQFRETFLYQSAIDSLAFAALSVVSWNTARHACDTRMPFA